MSFDVEQNYSRENFNNFLFNFLPDDFEPKQTETSFDFKYITNAFKLGSSNSLNLDVFEFETKSKRDPRVTLTREVVSCMKKYGYKQNALVVFYSKHSPQWRLSLITTDYEAENGKVKPVYSNPKRFSFMLGEGCKKHTPETMLSKKVTNLADLKSRFDIEVVTKEFYNALFNWYEWALDCVTFPTGDTTKTKNGTYRVHQSKETNELNLIRLITRFMFVWFIKQKDLIPAWIFDQNELNKVLADFDPESTACGNYYNAIIQNLFFATLNKKIEERAFADDTKIKYNKQFGVKNYYRDNAQKSFFRETNEQIIERFISVPFLNGGLFECLDLLRDDKTGTKNIQVFTDGFTRVPEWMAFIPNQLFWHADDGVHEGLINILNRYNFTVEENTPADVQVALDPELLGKVFENLLGTYNPETKDTARKSSGSFYTPRIVVHFMIDEALKNYLQQTVKNITEKQIAELFNDDELNYRGNNAEDIVHAIKTVTVLDPACGSGAFPMGMLQRMVHLIKKCNGCSDDEAEVYRLKLQLIENCLYGVDIQPIAVQICKLRFFISLICEQTKTENKAENYGFNPLPNLETKFVAADSLIGKNKNSGLSLMSAGIEEIKNQLQAQRHAHFTAQTAEEKAHCRQKDKELRNLLANQLEEDGWCDENDAKQLAAWNPYDQNAVSPFFDAEWMFNIKNGFDIVIGNPPYISTKGVSVKEKQIFESAFGFSDDLYNLFTFKGLSLCKPHGILTYITSKTFWTIQTKYNMRNLLLSNTLNYVFDTANPFESAMVDTCIFQVIKNKMHIGHKVKFYDGTKSLINPIELKPVEQTIFINSQNSVIFKPTESNMKIYNRYGKKIKELYDNWWNKIKTSTDIEKNKNELEQYRKSLKPGDITLLGCLTEGGQGLATGNNGKYIAIRRSTKWAENIIKTRPKKLEIAMRVYSDIEKDIGKVENTAEYLKKLSENEIAILFDRLKEKYGRDIFGKGYLYKIIDDTEIADVKSLTNEEKQNGILTSKKYYVPYHKGDKDGNRWYLETPFAIAWSKENVRFLRTNSGKKGKGMPVVRNSQFYFKEGFCWNNVLNPNSRLLKVKLKSASVNDVGSMSLMSVSKLVPNFFLISILNSEILFDYYREFINCSVNIQINDIRQIPVLIPTVKQLETLKVLFNKAISLKKQMNSKSIPTKSLSTNLIDIECKINNFVDCLYSV